MRAGTDQRNLVAAALACRCPRCDKGQLFQGLLTIRPRCPACGLDFSGQDAGDGGVVFVILILGALIAACALIAERLFAPPLWLHAILWIPLTLAGAIALLRPFKAFFVVQQYRVHRLDNEAG